MADLGLSKLLDSLFSPPTWIKVAVRSSLIEQFIALHFIISRQNRIWPFILVRFPTFYSQVSIIA